MENRGNTERLYEALYDRFGAEDALRFPAFIPLFFSCGRSDDRYMAAQEERSYPAELRPIGVIHSPYPARENAPRQGRLSDRESVIEVLPEYREGLQDIEHHPHLIILYWLDRSNRDILKATPPGSGIEHGVFATRSPDRPNPIGFAVGDLVRREANLLVVRGLDALDGTPLLDLKPYAADIDCVKD